MRIQVLHVAGCPSLPVLLERLTAVLGVRADVAVERRLIADERAARAAGMTGSPTLLVDGVDPFAGGTEPSLACRLYLDERGRVSGSPSVAQLRAALQPGWRFAATSARARRLPGGARGLHRAILTAFLDDGRAPDRTWLSAHSGSAADLRRLSTEDLIEVDDAGEVVVAYPFSGRPTAHRVALDGGQPVWAMCAIDALGLPRMARRDGVIESADPVTGEPIRVAVLDGGWTWEPAGAVVLVARSGVDGPTSCCACPHMNFHARAATAESYLDGRAELSGQVLDQRSAVELADLCFGELLSA